MREAEIKRKTNETDIDLWLCLDGTGKCEINTGCGFLDHMLTLFSKQVNSKFIKSFLYYVPYATLAAMTFPTIIHATQSPVSGLAALVVGVVTAWFGWDIFRVAFSCCGVVLLLEFFIR
mgnify:CR=1 FL=1